MNKYIIILISFVFMLCCAPSKNIRQKNNSDTYKNNSSNDSFFNWSADGHENNYEDLYSPDDDADNSDNEYEEKPKIKSRSSIISYGNIRDYDNKLDRKKLDPKVNHYPDITQKNNNNRLQYRKNDLKNKEFTKLKIYKVEKGDNLTKISKKFNIAISELAGINKIKKNARIREGMILKIPAGEITDKKTKIEYLSHQYRQKKPDFIWPIKRVYNTKRDGLDGVKPIGIIITGETGTSVFSSADGVVTKVGSMRGFGNYIILKHINQYLSIYSNLKDIKVNEGDKVKCGKSIGRLEGNKLHFQIDYSGKPQNPLIFLTSKS